MFEGSKEELTQTKVTQPAIFIHSMAILKILGESFKPDLVAGHSLGEFSALVASGVINYEDGLKLVSIRAKAMQKSCEKTNGTMAAILALDDNIIEQTCKEIEGVVVAANYNCPGQVVISGELNAVKLACLITRGDQVINIDDFGPDLGREASFAFIRQDLVDKEVVPEVGDIVEWHNDFYEVDTVRENQLIIGSDDSYNLGSSTSGFGRSMSIVVDCHLTRADRVGITESR